jgi:hypothetical protein
MTRLLLAAIAATILVQPVRAQERDDKARREEARRSVMIPWSWSARTADLGLSEAANELINVWMDFCRNKWQRRARRSRIFVGTPHEIWTWDEKRLALTVSFGNLEIVKAGFALKEAPRLLRACVDQNFVSAVRVDGDEEALLRLWGVVLATKVAAATEAALRLRAQEPHPKLWIAAKVKALEVLIEGFGNTRPTKEAYTRGPMMGAQRKLWLDAIQVIAAEKSGADLRMLYENMKQEGNPLDIEIAGKALAGAQGKEAEEYALAELASGDLQRQSRVILAIGPNVSAAVLTKLHALLKASDNRSLVLAGAVALQRAAERGSRTVDEARGLLLSLARELPVGGDKRTTVANLLVPLAGEDPAIVAFLKEHLTQMRKELDSLPDYQKPFQRQAIERIEKAIVEAEAEGE